MNGWDTPALGAYRTTEQKEWSRKVREGEVWFPWLEAWEQNPLVEVEEP